MVVDLVLVVVVVVVLVLVVAVVVILWATPTAAGPLVDRRSEIRRSSITSRSESPYIALSLHACILECLKSLSIMASFWEAFALTLHIEVGSMLGGLGSVFAGFGIEFESIWGRSSVSGGSWGCLGEVLGRSWELLGDSGAAFGRLWAPKIDF